MKQIILIATMLLTFGLVNAQSKIYTIDKYGGNKTSFLLINGG